MFLERAFPGPRACCPVCGSGEIMNGRKEWWQRNRTRNRYKKAANSRVSYDITCALCLDSGCEVPSHKEISISSSLLKNVPLKPFHFFFLINPIHIASILPFPSHRSAGAFTHYIAPWTTPQRVSPIC